MADLKLQALDSEDLNILSALCQDAVVQVANLSYSAASGRVAVVCNRFDWPAVQPGQRGHAHATYTRKRAGLRFERVNRVQYAGFDPRQGGTVLALLAIEFAPTDAPAGQITLQFAAGASLRLDVEYIEAELKDLGAEWSTKYKPDHDAEAAAPDTVAGVSKPERS